MKVTKVTVESALKDLCQNLAETFVGNKMLNYGEAVESILEGSAGNYVTKDGNSYCAVNDTYPIVLFLVRESASVEPTPAGGRATSLLRRVNFKLIANSTIENAEFGITSIINRTKGITYAGTDFNSKAIATQYFGIPERNFETFFFSIDFQVTERISCEVTC
jgi:hypothetical protein